MAKTTETSGRDSAVTISLTTGSMRVDLIETADGRSAMLSDNGAALGVAVPEDGGLALTLFPEAKMTMGKSNPINSMTSAMAYTAKLLDTAQGNIVVKNEEVNPGMASIVNTAKYLLTA